VVPTIGWWPSSRDLEDEVLDYHLHLWPHEDAETPLTIEQLAAYCEAATAQGVDEIALTEHFFRFHQAVDLVGPFWEDSEPDPALCKSMADYVAHHAHADLDDYVELVLEAKRQGLPIKLGIEVDYYRGQMGPVGELLGGYPFDLLLGSVHWVGAWRFDHLDDALQMSRWEAGAIDACWDAYTEALEELAASGSCDVLAHPDVIKAAGRIPSSPAEWWDRIAEATAANGLAAELSSSGWRTPASEQYPAIPLLDRLVAAGVPLTTASDAHRLERVGDRVADLVGLARAAGVTSLASFEGRELIERAI
jgi:histidinol-phosphatase (PHP family)